MLLIPIALCAAFVWVVMARESTPSYAADMRARGIDPAIAIVRQRYARGQMTTRDYERIITDLSCKP